jgi:hypothetical protein
MDLRGGSLLRADGGYLIMYCSKRFPMGVARWKRNPESQPARDSAARNVLSVWRQRVAGTDSNHVKVILIGDREMYELMYDYGSFRKIFKVLNLTKKWR